MVRVDSDLIFVISVFSPVLLSLRQVHVQFFFFFFFFFNIGSYSLLALSLFFTRVHGVGFHHCCCHLWVLFLALPFLQSFLITSPSQSLISWPAGLHCLIHLFLVSLSLWIFFAVYLLAYHTVVLPVNVS